jgi:hypothetical protein
MAERLSREEMREINLTFDFKKFVAIGRKVAIYQKFQDVSIGETEAYKLNKKKMPVAQFVQQPQLTASWGGSSIYESTI